MHILSNIIINRIIKKNYLIQPFIYEPLYIKKHIQYYF